MDKIESVISGQSFRKSRSRSRRFVRKSAILEGPGVHCGVDVEGGFRLFGGGTRRLRERARDELLVDEDILEKRGFEHAMRTWYQSFNFLGVLWNRSSWKSTWGCFALHKQNGVPSRLWIVIM